MRFREAQRVTGRGIAALDRLVELLDETRDLLDRIEEALRLPERLLETLRGIERQLASLEATLRTIGFVKVLRPLMRRVSRQLRSTRRAVRRARRRAERLWRAFEARAEFLFLRIDILREHIGATKALAERALGILSRLSEILSPLEEQQNFLESEVLSEAQLEAIEATTGLLETAVEVVEALLEPFEEALEAVREALAPALEALEELEQVAEELASLRSSINEQLPALEDVQEWAEENLPEAVWQILERIQDVLDEVDRLMDRLLDEIEDRIEDADLDEDLDRILDESGVREALETVAGLLRDVESTLEGIEEGLDAFEEQEEELRERLRELREAVGHPRFFELEGRAEELIRLLLQIVVAKTPLEDGVPRTAREIRERLEKLREVLERREEEDGEGEGQDGEEGESEGEESEEDEDGEPDEESGLTEEERELLDGFEELLRSLGFLISRAFPLGQNDPEFAGLPSAVGDTRIALARLRIGLAGGRVPWKELEVLRDVVADVDRVAARYRRAARCTGADRVYFEELKEIAGRERDPAPPEDPAFLVEVELLEARFEEEGGELGDDWRFDLAVAGRSASLRGREAGGRLAVSALRYGATGNRTTLPFTLSVAEEDPAAPDIGVRCSALPAVLADGESVEAKVELTVAGEGGDAGAEARIDVLFRVTATAVP